MTERIERVSDTMEFICQAQVNMDRIKFDPEWDYVIDKILEKYYNKTLCKKFHDRRIDFSIGDCEITCMGFSATINCIYCTMIKIISGKEIMIFSDVIRKKKCVRGNYLFSSSKEFAKNVLTMLQVGL